MAEHVTIGPDGYTPDAGEINRTLDQIGRALAMYGQWRCTGSTTGGGREWVVLRRKDGVRTVGVNPDTDRVAEYSEGAWKRHPISRELDVTEVRPGIFVITGDTYEHREMLKGAGGLFRRYTTVGGPGWLFVGPLPEAVAALVAQRRWTKYEFLRALKVEGEFCVNVGDMTVAEARFRILDGYQRELWRVYSMDYHSFPAWVSSSNEEC